MCKLILSFVLKTFRTSDFSCDFLLLIDVNEWIDKECAECMLLRLNIRVWFTRSHPLKVEIALEIAANSLWRDILAELKTKLYMSTVNGIFSINLFKSKAKTIDK